MGLRFATSSAPWLTTGIILGIGLLTAPVHAHISILSHRARNGGNIKQGPCGTAGSVRADEVAYTYAPGDTLTLVWDEPIPHPGYFRIAFDDDGDDDFIDPADYDDFYTNDAVLLDDLYPHLSAASYTEYSYDVTLPDIECDRCTLQLVQMMKDKGPYVVGTNDLYYACVELILSATAPPTGPAPDPTPSDERPIDPNGETVPGALEGPSCQQSSLPMLSFLILMMLGCTLTQRRRS